MAIKTVLDILMLLNFNFRHLGFTQTYYRSGIYGAHRMKRTIGLERCLHPGKNG